VRTTVKFVALLCMALTIWSAIAYTAHHHSGNTESVKCTVCVAVHSSAPKAGVNLVKAVFRAIASFDPVSFSAKKRFVAFALSVRPPPAL